MRDCEGTIDPRTRGEILLCNQGSCFEAHEGFEVAWREEAGKSGGVSRGSGSQRSVSPYPEQNLTGELKVID